MNIDSGTGTPRFQSLRVYKSTLILAYQSFGVVYGDLSISPIYVYKSTFSGRLQLHEDDDEIFGVLSLVFWTLTLIPLLKYIIFVLGADDNGEGGFMNPHKDWSFIILFQFVCSLLWLLVGGTFALYSLLCRRAKVGLLNSPYIAYEQTSNCDTENFPIETNTSALIKEFFEKHRSSRIILFLAVLLGTSMVIGDGVLTPTMSVLSAVSGVQTKVPNLHETLWNTQGWVSFAPVLIAWLVCISAVGIYNIILWNPHVFRALSPYYIYNFFKVRGKDGWSSLGGIVLCITGAEAMFADLGHFSKLSLRMAFTGVVYPCLILAYMGEAAYLSKHKADLQRSFYKAIPEFIFWPVFIIATLATVVGSQAIISATFSIISQCRSLKCFPCVKIIHKSSEIHGQVYIPEVNWCLMVLCLAVTIGFKDTEHIGNAYGLAVITVMFVTTCLMFLVITTIWKRTTLAALSFVAIFGSVELLYFSSCLVKILRGGWLPLLISLIVLSMMCTWHYGTSKKQDFELQNKVCLDQLLSLSPSLGIVRVPGIGLVCSNVSSGVPPMFAHFVTNFPAFHRILIFVSMQSLMVPKVPPHEQFMISRIGPPEYRLFQCVVRYGYKDDRESYEFENRLIVRVAEFLQCEGLKENNVRELVEARESGVAYMIGHTCVVARRPSPLLKKVAIDFMYGFLRRNFRRPAVALGIPHEALIEVGMVYHV